MRLKIRQILLINIIICNLSIADIFIIDSYGAEQNLLAVGLSTVFIPESGYPNSLNIEKIPVDIFIPPSKDYSGDILVLPGWNFSRKEWQNKSEIIKIAGLKNLRLAFPEMKTTLYESQYFPETRRKWAATPGGQWIKELLIPSLQKQGLFLKGGKNFLLGLSTGGRGVALISLANPGLFKAGASLSGDFDQTSMPLDRLMTYQYGQYDIFKKRWEDVDNPQRQVSDWIMPVYLGHGKKDIVVPLSHTINFYNSLKNAHPEIDIILSTPETAGHDFNYWASELLPVFEFFLSVP